jgi:uncharacterized protein YcsI (UPF0317 family)
MTTPCATPFTSPAALREAIRCGQFSGPTAGQSPGFVQANLVIVPQAAARDFEAFCRLNPQACPLLAQTEPGNPEPVGLARGSDLRTDVPRYRVFRQGRCDPDEPQDIRDLWRADLVAFLLGCSFTFERALEAAGLPVRHLDEHRNVPMYRTGRACQPAGMFSGPLVVSMRPYPPAQVEQVIAVTRRYPRMHGAPVHVGEPAALGIADLARPDFGDAVTIRPGEVPVFWACGVTPQLALTAAGLDLAITHSPGCMFVTDLDDRQFLTNA